MHLRFDTPPLDVKLYLFDLAPFLKGAWLEAAEEGAILRAKGTQAPLLLLGQSMTVMLARRDEKSRRWVFEPVTE